MNLNKQAGPRAADSEIDSEQSRNAILSSLRSADGIADYMSLCRKWRDLEHARSDTGTEPLRIALLSGATTDLLELPLRAELASLGLRAGIHRCDFNTHVSALLESDSTTAAFRPNVAVVLLDLSDISEWPAAGDDETAVSDCADSFVGRWLGLCEAFHNNTGAEIILGNLRLPTTSPNGHLSRQLPWDRTNFVRRINQLLADKAPRFVHTLDIEALSAQYGLKTWFDPRFWHHAKQSVSLDCIVPLVRDTAGIIAAFYGKTAKCIVLDLDNTIWGGVVGDDGVDGIRIGPGGAEGEAFQAFQSYLLQLKQRGILLAVCSKNEEANALAPFEELEGMVLKRDDIVAFKANWEPKPTNIQAIAAELNIGLDAIVFVDDNPAERALVRQAIPDVKVLELSDDPSDYPLLLDRSGWLQTLEITKEDQRKSEQYRANHSRAKLAEQVLDYDSYLASLEQKAAIRPFDAQNLDRITQLINKTNQFNLTTLRMTQTEVDALVGRPDAITAYMRLSDTFGDNGLIGVVAGHVEGGTLFIDLWLMSCRVFKRGAEHAMANYVMQAASHRGITKVSGLYKPTVKNGLVAGFYGELGFSKEAVDGEGNTTWTGATADFQPLPVFIEVKEEFS